MVAFKLLVSRVDDQVGLKMPFCDKLGLAVAADEGALARVSPYVRLQIPCVLEFLEAVVEGANQNFELFLGSNNFLNMGEFETSLFSKFHLAKICIGL